MRSVLMVFLAVLFGASVGFADSRHYEAENCEFYVEKIQLIPGSYQSVSANVYLKVALPHLDGAIKTIGFRAVSQVIQGAREEVLEWRNIPADLVTPFGLEDQWKVNLLLEAGGMQSIHEGSFYLQTTSGTWYWLHPNHKGDKNFVIDSTMFVQGHEMVWNELWINDFPHLASFNPEGCQ